MTVAVASPHGAAITERQSLAARFESRLSVNDFFNRRLVSYQGNRKVPGLRWLKYKEGFSSQLVGDLIEAKKPRGAFAAQTEKEIARARCFLVSVANHGLRTLLDLACMSVLEDASYTRKDGQYLKRRH